MNKLLLILFAVFMAVVIGESFYYFAYLKTQPARPTSTNSNKKTTVGISASSSAKIVYDWKHRINTDKFYRDINPFMAVDPKVLDTLLFYNKSIMTSSVNKNTNQGKINQIDAKGGKAFYDYYNYKLLIRLEPENGDTNQANWSRFYFSEDDLKKTKFFAIVSGKEQPITMNDLKAGDIIKIEDEIDLMRSEPLNKGESTNYTTRSWGINRISVKITKLK